MSSYVHSAQTPESARYAIPNSMKRRLGLDGASIGKHVYAACGGMEVDVALKTFGVQTVWDMIDAYVERQLNPTNLHSFVASEDGKVCIYYGTDRTATCEWERPGSTRIQLSATGKDEVTIYEGHVFERLKGIEICELWMTKPQMITSDMFKIEETRKVKV